MINKIALRTVQEAIKTAFADVPRPDDQDFAMYQLISGSDGWHLAENLRKYSWRDIPIHVLAECYELPLFTNAAFQYFLPAFMLGRLEEPEQVDVAGVFVIYSLLPPQEALEKEKFEELFKRFSSGQKHAIRLFLEAVITDTGANPRVAEEAFNRFWRTY